MKKQSDNLFQRHKETQRKSNLKHQAIIDNETDPKEKYRAQLMLEHLKNLQQSSNLEIERVGQRASKTRKNS